MRKFKLSPFMSALWLFFSISLIAGLLLTGAVSRNGAWLQCLILAAFLVYMNILVFSLEINLTPSQISISAFMSKRISNYEDFHQIKDDNFLLWHLYWIIGHENKKVILTNLGISNYPELLGNIIMHVKPETDVDEKILRHLGMKSEDVGKYYKSDKWLTGVKVRSYWTEKL